MCTVGVIFLCKFKEKCAYILSGSKKNPTTMGTYWKVNVEPIVVLPQSMI